MKNEIGLYGGMKQATFYITPETYKKLKKVAFAEDPSLRERGWMSAYCRRMCEDRIRRRRGLLRHAEAGF